MDVNPPVELEGQTSINELLKDPIGTLPVQLPLPFHFQWAEAARRVS
jgi:hypothetical protein